MHVEFLHARINLQMSFQHIVLRTPDEDEARDWVNAIQRTMSAAQREADLELDKSKVRAEHLVLKSGAGNSRTLMRL